MENGRALGLLKQEMDAAIASAQLYPELSEMALDLGKAMAMLEKTTMTLGAVAMEKGPDAYLADASLFLEMFGILVIGWQWLTMADAALLASGKEGLKKKDALFYKGKVHVAHYFFSYELPKMEGLAQTLENSGQMTLAMPGDCFTD